MVRRKHERPQARRHRRRFTGERTDTRVVRDFKTSDGRKYQWREEGSIYPKLTSIPVCKSTLNVYGMLRDEGNYDNYDELLLDLALSIVNARSLPAPSTPKGFIRLDKFTVEMIKKAVEKETKDVMRRKKNRVVAVCKHRYFKRRTPMEHKRNINRMLKGLPDEEL